MSNSQNKNIKNAQKVLETLLPKTYCVSVIYTVQHHSLPQTMPKSRLFKRNMPRTQGTKSPGWFRPASARGYRAPNPRPLAMRSIPKVLSRKKDFVENSATASVSPAVQHLDIIDQGTGFSDRNGQRTQIIGLHVRGRINWSPSNSTTNVDQVGYYVVWDRTPSGNLSQAAEILNLTGGQDANTAFPNLNGQDRFIMLARKSWLMTKVNASATVVANANTQIELDDYFGFARSLTTVSNLGITSGVIAQRTSGALYLIPFGGIATDLNPSEMTFNYRVHFTDL